LIKGRLGLLDDIHINLQHWLKFFAFGGTVKEEEMTQMVNNDPYILEAMQVLKRFTADDEVQDYARRRLLADFDRQASLDDAREEGLVKGIAKGKAEGIVEGKAKGLAEGKAEGVVLSILQILKTRFDSVPMKLQNRLFEITDLTYLESLTSHAIKCRTLKAFQNALD
jgi:flagellar biosynthesis/type III secretory pathway protein FliH